MIRKQNIGLFTVRIKQESEAKILNMKQLISFMISLTNKTQYKTMANMEKFGVKNIEEAVK